MTLFALEKIVFQVFAFKVASFNTFGTAYEPENSTYRTEFSDFLLIFDC